MKSSGLVLETPWEVCETQYDLNVEANIATLFTTGNGYIGVRGSLEEFGSVRIQGAYIRGVSDRIVEIPNAFVDNVYMKKYYFNEEGLRHFEKQDCIVNFADFLCVRIFIDGELFLPWEGTLLDWKRTLDIGSNVLRREVRWENSKGQITRFVFERFSSFANDHVYAQCVRVIPENYSAPIEILSGIDRTVKTNGQFICIPVSSEADGNIVQYTELSGEHFRFPISTACASRLVVDEQEFGVWNGEDGEDVLGSRIAFDAVEGKEYRLEKFTYVITSREIENMDPYAGSGNPNAEPEDVRIAAVRNAARKGIEELSRKRYSDCFASHICAWNDVFSTLDVKIEGDDIADRSLRFSNYHTAITLARRDHVHSLSAKGLTGDIYNNFVWWDCEIYQAPVFYHTMPEAARETILYRYEKLDAARKNARKENMPGVRFPFTSSITGEETVWAYARHPFLQIHIVADVAFGVLNYFQCTGDEDLLINYGMEILCEVCRWWKERVTFCNGRYEIHNVTGTDEHHPYINNNAYTNYEVAFIMKQTAALCERYAAQLKALEEKINLSADEWVEWKNIADAMYLPMEPNGMIPQFDGYFDLSRKLEVVGSGGARFQMKQAGLYHKSQVIKQPDVLLLFTYLGMAIDNEVYARNFDYYLQRCESSSSLSYSVHAIAGADVGRPDTAYDQFLKAARLDMDDEHDCAFQGMHTACAAGAWLAAVRGFGGTELKSDGVHMHPHMVPWWRTLSYSLFWHGQRLKFTLTTSEMTVTSCEENTTDVPLFTPQGVAKIAPGESFTFTTALTTTVKMPAI